MYPRVSDKGELISNDQMVDYREHLISRHRLLFATGVLTYDSEMTNLLLAMDSINHAPIKIVVTSGGGMMDVAFQIIDTFKLIKSPIYTLGRYCASAAVFLLASGQKGRRYLFPHAQVMLHLPSAQYGGDIKELTIQHKEMIKYQDELVRLLQECGVCRTKEQILDDIDREHWMTPTETIDYGLADAVMTPKTMKEWLK